jgi:hypothetical protein
MRSSDLDAVNWLPLHRGVGGEPGPAYRQRERGPPAIAEFGLRLETTTGGSGLPDGPS